MVWHTGIMRGVLPKSRLFVKRLGRGVLGAPTRLSPSSARFMRSVPWGLPESKSGRLPVFFWEKLIARIKQ